MSKLIELEGKLHLKATQEGGRKSYILSGYRPTFRIEGKLFSGMILLEKLEKACPGETVAASVYFIPGSFEYVFSTGTDLAFTEGPKIVGDFLITKVNGVVDWDPNILIKAKTDHLFSEMVKIMTSENLVGNGKVSRLIDEAVKSQYSDKKEVKGILHI